MEEQKTGLSVKERMKMFQNSKPVEVTKEKPTISTGVSVKDRLAALQQNSKPAEKPNTFIPQSIVKEPNSAPVPAQAPTASPVINTGAKFKNSTESAAIPSYNVPRAEMKQEVSVFTYQSENKLFKNEEKVHLTHQTDNVEKIAAGQNAEFKKKMEGIVFRPPGISYEEVKTLPKERKISPGLNSGEEGKFQMTELNKPIRKRALRKFEADFD